MHRFLLLLLLPPLLSLSAAGQVNSGELRLSVTDQDGLAVRASIELLSQGNQYRSVFVTDETGKAEIQTLPYGLYLLTARKQGFAETSTSIEVRSALPTECKIKLQVAGVNTTIRVNAASTLIDPDRPSSIMQIGTRQIEDRVQSLPGRSVQDLVITQPGWIYEGNAVLHPRGSEYQTQFVVDGMPLTDNRSPSFGPEVEADDVESMSIYTAGFPAEFGRKMGGVIELNTRRNPDPGLHGQLVLSGGSYDTAQGYGRVQDTWGKNTIGATASGSMTSHYLNPVVPENYTNDGTTGDFSLKYEGNFTARDRLTLGVRHALSRFEIPNELIQQEAGQLQNGGNLETMGTATYSHIFSTDMLAAVNGMVRDTANNLKSNELSTPVIATQNNDFREGYFKAALSIHHGNQEWRTGVESDNTFLNEDFSYVITDPDDFDDGTPPELTFTQNRPDLEQSAFVEDLIRLGKWTVRAGLRWDHYQLLLNEHAFSPRLSVGRYFPSAKIVVHASYDRIFQTPSFENILISSSSEVTSLNPEVLRLPVAPSKGNYYEGGISKAFADKVRLDINVYRRNVNNFADDDQLLNTGVSYPIAFDKAVIYGAEGKLDVVRLGKLTGYASYSYMVGNVWYPVTGGLFLGDDVTDALSQTSGHFPNSQDQRNTVRTRFQYQLIRRMWAAGGLSYGSGLPFEYGGTYEDALAQYGPEVVDRVNFDRGRVKPSLALNASVGFDVYKSERLNMRFQADGDNLNGRLNVIDFGGLFSGNAIGPGRSFGLRLNSTF
jgi:Carboxypeptidase regulatory-like domain/TonB-dependent Receptor Plug Domain